VLVAGGLAFRRVSASGRFHSCGVTTDDVAYCWGTNAFGQLGDGTQVDSPAPVAVGGGLEFRDVIAGILHSCGVTTQNTAYCWGHNQAGELGHGDVGGASQPVRVARGLSFAQVDGGTTHTCGLTTTGEAYCWGTNLLGELGTGSPLELERCPLARSCSIRPLAVLGGFTYRSLQAGGGHSCAATERGVAYCWGRNDQGQVGDGSIDRRRRPRRVAAPI
jgi:alpha-tubulin suppressor-like RCC1 family protein